MSVPGSMTNRDLLSESDLEPPLSKQFLRVRNKSEEICAPLETEDYGIQTMVDVSPPKWHLAHVSWFFETFLLLPYLKNYQAFHPQFAHLFNSYYETAGTFHPRPERGLLSRPTVADVYRYREHVNQHMLELLNNCPQQYQQDIAQRTCIGINHEQQHQELMLTDIKHIFAYNPLQPVVYSQAPAPVVHQTRKTQWVEFEETISITGHSGDGFCYDNELPAHKTLIHAYKLASKLVTNGEYLEFIEAGGYRKVDIWLSDAWKHLNNNNWQSPLYYKKIDGQWWQTGLSGLHPVNEHAPVSHVSFYEADAFARWKGKRLPTEHEWENAVKNSAINGNLLQSGYLQPVPAQTCDELNQMYGDTWEWTQSPYTPYPRYKPLAGTLGEYNGKFMSSQMVLKGGSCYTADDHIRASYRNFFYPKDQWQCSGIRLAE